MMNDNAQSSGQQQVFEIQKIFQKDISFEAPNSPQIFTQEWKPDTNVQITTESKKLEENVQEVVLNITVTTKSGDKTAYLVEIQQAGIFTMKGFAEQQLGHLLGSYCPNILFPFARELVAELIAKGGFPHLLLAPVNFDALYAQHQQHLKQEVQSSKAAH
ncbi:MAG: protein-export chaperone SecB [Pseudomonadota bacterium]